MCICKLLENSPGQEYPVPAKQILLPRVYFFAPLVTSVQMPLPAQNFARLLCPIPFWLGLMKQSYEMYSLSDERWEKSHRSWPHLKAYVECVFRESAAGTAKHVHWDAAHMLVHVLVVQLAFLLPNTRRSWQGSKACTKTCTTRRGSGHVDVKQINQDDASVRTQNKNDTSIDFTGRREFKNNRRLCNYREDNALPATRPRPKQCTQAYMKTFLS